MFRHIYAICIFAVFSAVTTIAYGQSAQLQGRVSDNTGAVIPKATVRVMDERTNIARKTQTNSAGEYVVAGLNPSVYKIFVDATGFSSAVSTSVTLNVDQKAVLDFELRVGGGAETVTVNDGSAAINTTDATVGSVVDRQFVADIPLNGRSFQSLILLSPGVTTTTPQGNGGSGTFSVNGQPSTNNNFLVDGASASNTNNTTAGGAGIAGMSSNSTVFGTTQALISVDALQEFKIATSTYSAEFGRQPGAQISFQSRSGTNQYHGTAYDYLRNSVLDASDWFNGYVTPALPKAQERQNDFGGTFGGPVFIPLLLSNKERAFFFLTYEGLRLTQPASVSVNYVPSNGTYNTATYTNSLYKNLRQNAPAALQPVLNSFSVPNCSVDRDAQCIDYGDGMSPALFVPSTTGGSDSISGRFDFNVSPSVRIFARYSGTDSHRITYENSGYENIPRIRTRVYLVGVNTIFGPSATNELRLQYSSSFYRQSNVTTPLGGAQQTNFADLQGIPSNNAIAMYLDFAHDSISTYTLISGTVQNQPNATDTLTWQHGNHLFKAGVNYIQTTAYMADPNWAAKYTLRYYYTSADLVLSNTLASASVVNSLRQDPTFKNLGVFFQDEWRYRPRLSLSLGLRYDISPPPSVSGAVPYTYYGDLNNPASVTLAPQGTPLYNTAYKDFAPRFGMAAVIHNDPGHELVFRAGGGLFYGTGQNFNSTFGTNLGLGSGYTQNFSATNQPQNVPFSFPFPTSVVYKPIPTPGPTYAFGYLPTRDYAPSFTIQWSAALEQAFGKFQSVSLSYVATNAPKLGHWTEYSFGALNPLFSSFYAWGNGAGSNYNSLQLQYKRQAFRGLQVQAGYTWAHAIDSNSTDAISGLPLQRGNSSNDIRHNFNAALVYVVPKQYTKRWQRATFSGWDIDLRLTMRTAFPVQVQGSNILDPVTGDYYSSRLDYNGKNPYVYKKGIPGGRQFDPTVFSVPTAAEGNDGNSPRNFLRGFGEFQADTAVQRTFPLYDTLKLLFRVEAFNLPNHPSFGTLNVTCGATAPGAVCNTSIFGQATGSLARAGVGGLVSIYQPGGARSLQLALKLQF